MAVNEMAIRFRGAGDNEHFVRRARMRMRHAFAMNEMKNLANKSHAMLRMRWKGTKSFHRRYA
jgi:hypothetical protein